jgi:hypothetical protein
MSFVSGGVEGAALHDNVAPYRGGGKQHTSVTNLIVLFYGYFFIIAVAI